MYKGVSLWCFPLYPWWAERSLSRMESKRAPMVQIFLLMFHSPIHFFFLTYYTRPSIHTYTYLHSFCSAEPWISWLPEFMGKLWFWVEWSCWRWHSTHISVVFHFFIGLKTCSKSKGSIIFLLQFPNYRNPDPEVGKVTRPRERYPLFTVS